MTGIDIGELVSSCERSANHLEMRDGYMRSAQMFKDWQAGLRDDPADRSSWWRPWHDHVATARRRGVTVQRARIVSEPVSEYIRFEYDLTHRNIAAGEEVRWLTRRRASDLLLPVNDFWVFDSRVLLWNYFTGEGEVAPDGLEISEDPAIVKACSAAFESVWERATLHEEYRLALLIVV